MLQQTYLHHMGVCWKTKRRILSYSRQPLAALHTLASSSTTFRCAYPIKTLPFHNLTSQYNHDFLLAKTNCSTATAQIVFVKLPKWIHQVG